MKSLVLLSCSLLLSVTTFAADVPEPAGVAEVRELGRLNGLALSCSQVEAAARIKNILIQYAPKTRRYGEAFEAATQESFLEQGAKPEPCRDGAAYAVEAEVVALRLRAAAPQEAK
ncbi:MAG: hypothetical protein KGZ83_01285 [Sulfuricella sp.]|nr:hypothetical protein [Sulfuricella sp.]